MTKKQTRCPNCHAVYKVSVTQLTVAQGMVCCPKCSTNFNALLNLQSFTSTTENDVTQETLDNDALIMASKRPIETHLLDIFDRKVEHSNIDLRTYLNNLNYFNNEPLNSIPTLNLSKGFKEDRTPRYVSSKSILYYAGWTAINIILLGILLFQIAWFNPSFIDRYPALNHMFTQTCAVLHCDTIDQRYKHIALSNITSTALDQEQTRFSGSLTNHYSKSLELPLIVITLKAHNRVVATHTLTPDQYLIKSLVGIKRIPQNSPYPFNFVVPEPRNSFDQYHLEVIHP